jgi:uncharacterized protein YecE (DUF72 family)
MAKGHIYIGTSGWHYQHWIGTYYPSKTKPSEQLSLYVKDFSTVELNNPFYRLPSRQTFANWRRSVPENFLFSVKASRFITHMKKLKDPAESLSQFLTHASALKEKLGPILFQLPPNWKLNIERLNDFLGALPKKKFRYVFEFRNETWYTPEVFKALEKYNCAFCFYELDHHVSPFKVTADFVYVRLHGPGHKYQGSYKTSSLKQWQKKGAKWSGEGKDVFIYFDNDQAGYAAFNAKSLSRMIQV